MTRLSNIDWIHMPWQAWNAYHDFQQQMLSALLCNGHLTSDKYFEYHRLPQVQELELTLEHVIDQCPVAQW